MMSSEAAAPMTAATVREQVLEQHGVLRTFLQEALTATTDALRGNADALARLDHIVRALRSRFRAHLAFEERHMVPILAATDVWGPMRVRHLLEEHACQRAELDTLVEGIETDWDAERLAVATRSLVTELLLDMDEEERGCLDADLLRDDVVSIDQATD